MEATNFDIRISKEAAMDLIRPGYYHSGKTYLAEELGIDVMNKEYGEDDDWVGVNSDDYQNLRQDDYYKTFELWLPIRRKTS